MKPANPRPPRRKAETADHRFLIRQAQLGDVAAVARFNRAMAFETEGKRLSKASTENGTRSLIASPTYGFYLVALEAGRVVGQLCITYEWSDWHNGVYWWIQSVYVDPRYRRQGVFRALFQEVRRQKQATPGTASLRLYADATNRKAQGVYRKLGMQKTAYEVFELKD